MAMVIAIIVAIIAVMRWLWLLSWDGYDYCYEMAMVAAMVIAMVAVME